MKLWILSRSKFGYDEHDAMVVRAKDENEARALANGQASYTNGNVWLDTARSKCIQLRADGPAAVILASFNQAG